MHSGLGVVYDIISIVAVTKNGNIVYHYRAHAKSGAGESPLSDSL